MVSDIGGPTSSEQRVRKVLREIRSGSRMGRDEFAERVGHAGFQVSPAAVRGYEEGRTKKVPIAYVDAVCRAFGASPASFFAEDLDGGPGSPDEADRQLSAIRRILRESTPGAQGRAEAPHDPESLRRRFLSAISEYSDLEVERICDLNHETVRQYRQGQWPTRGPNASTEGKIEGFLELHGQRRTAAATVWGISPGPGVRLLPWCAGPEQLLRQVRFANQQFELGPDLFFFGIPNHGLRVQQGLPRSFEVERRFDVEHELTKLRLLGVAESRLKSVMPLWPVEGQQGLRPLKENLSFPHRR